MIYLGVEYGTKLVLENPLAYPSPSGKTNKIIDPLFGGTFGTAWQGVSTTVALTEVKVPIATGEVGNRAAVEVAKETEGYLQTKTPIKVGVERVDYGFWVLAPAGRIMKLESVSYKTGETSPVGVASTFVGTGVWQWVSTSRVMPAATTEARFRVGMSGTSNALTAFYVWGAMVTTGRSTNLLSTDYFPLPKQLEEGYVKWLGTTNESATEFYNYLSRVVFNDSTDPDYVGDLDPESSGLDAPEIREDSNDRVESDGAIFGDFFSGKRPIVLQGRVIATSKAQRNERVGKLRAATLAKVKDATLWWEDAAGGKVFVNVRRQQPLRVTKGWVKEFQLALVAADSRILSYQPVSVSAKGITLSSQEKTPTEAGELFISSPAYSGTWVNPNNVKVSDNVYATNKGTTLIELGSFAAVQPLVVRNFGFTLPTTVIPVGVEVKVEAKGEEAGKIYTGSVRINRNVFSLASVNEDTNGENGGQLYGGAKINNKDYTKTFLTTSDVVTTYGGPSDMWLYNKYLTPTIINSASFGAYVEFLFTANKTISLDNMAIKITYVEPLKVTATNEGDAPAPAIIKVKGPFENFYVLNQTTGEILTYTGKVEAGKEIWFDTENVTVTERGTGITEPINRFANVGLPNDWIRIYPGANTILVAGTGGNSNTEVAVEYRHAWE